MAIEYRWAEGQFDRLPALAAELVRRQVAVIVTRPRRRRWRPKRQPRPSPSSSPPAKTRLGSGLVASLARPGGNLTGINFFTAELAAKRLELLRELVPGSHSCGRARQPGRRQDMPRRARETWKRLPAPWGMQIQVLNASTSREIDAAFATFARERPDALFVGADGLFTSRRVQLVTLAARHAIPATSADREFAEAGGLMSYGSNIMDAYRQAGVYAGRILKGAKPADLPVVQASKFELVINHKTARMLGLKVPPTLLARADEVIE